MEGNSKGVIKTNSAESPGGNKTSGGISKALLTPCRRVGLSRTWKKSGSSPFISPLSSANTTVQDVEESKLKETSTERDSGVSSASTCKDYQNLRNANIVAQAKNQESNANKIIVNVSPNKLSKECITVLQKKMFKTDKTIDHNNITRQEKKVNSTANPSSSQPLSLDIDSDSDDLPLFVLNKKYNKVSENKCITTGQNTQKPKQDDTVDKLDDDFVDNNVSTVKRLKDKTTSTTEIQTKVKKRNKNTKTRVKSILKTPSQSSKSFDDDDDDDDFRLCNKKTILVKKTYNKIVQPTRAKSTGSITQNDIDELKARIESKKNLLLAKTMTKETQELRGLIKKWQIGCQTALMDLLELMKKKMPEQNMDNPKLLETLKIPPDLVGYDSENDCFNTPEDANIILSALKLN